MTVEEFLDKYGDVDVAFSYYHKFVFTYTGIAPDGNKITVYEGGNADDAYEVSVGSNEIRKVRGIIVRNWSDTNDFSVETAPERP